MAPESLFSVPIFLLFLINCSTKTSLAQSPAAAPTQPPPAPTPRANPPSTASSSSQVAPLSGPLDVVKILNKAGHFSVFVRLLKATQEDTELYTQLNNTNNGATIFAPNDNSFFSLKVGTLNSLTDGQKAELVKFHVIPKFIGSSQFQTESNPERTQAGTGGRLSLNITVAGSSVNISTGLTNASVSGTVYSDNRLAIYQVDKVLLPLDVFTPKPPAPAPAPAQEKPKTKEVPAAESPVVPKNVNNGVDSSVTVGVVDVAVSLAVCLAAAILFG